MPDVFFTIQSLLKNVAAVAIGRKLHYVSSDIHEGLTFKKKKSPTKYTLHACGYLPPFLGRRCSLKTTLNCPVSEAVRIFG